MKLIIKNGNKNYLGLEKSTAVLESLLLVLMQAFFGRQTLWSTQACLLTIL